MTILLIGGTGKTATRVATSLNAINKPFLLASRHPEEAPSELPAIKFDWTDEITWAKPFGEDIEAIYMMEPQIAQPWVLMIKFVDYAKEQGVRRFVLCGSTTTTYGQEGMGKVWEYYATSGLDYCVLRPPWFMGEYHRRNPFSSTGH